MERVESGMKKYAMFLVGLLLALQVALGGCSAPLGSPTPGVTPSITPVSFTPTPAPTPDPQPISYPFVARNIYGAYFPSDTIPTAVIRSAVELKDFIAQEKDDFEIYIKQHPEESLFFQRYSEKFSLEIERYGEAFFQDHVLFIIRAYGLSDFSSEVRSVTRKGDEVTIDVACFSGVEESLTVWHYVFIECEMAIQPTDVFQFIVTDVEQWNNGAKYQTFTFPPRTKPT
nr:hypothetical protein [bacterium]